MGWFTDPNELAQSFVNPLTTAIVIYAIICVPAYLWLQGPVGTAGMVGPGVVSIGLALGSILLVPIIKAGLERRFGRTGWFVTDSRQEVN